LRENKVRVELEKALEATVARVGEVIRCGVEAQTFACDDANAAASALVAVVQGYFVMAATARKAIPKGSAARSARRMAEGLLRPAHPLTTQGARCSTGETTSCA